MTNKKKLKIILDILFVLIIAIVTIIQSINMNVPSLETDEYGYLGSAAFFSGFDWSKHISKSNGYFSYIYGFIISPILRFIPNALISFRCMQGLNVVVLIINYFIMQRVIVFLELPVNILQKRIFSVMATLYCSNIIFGKCILPECFLVLFFDLSVYLLYKFCQKKRWIYCMLLTCSNLILCTMHQRTISIVIATAVILIFMLINKNSIKIGHIVFFVAVMIAGIAIYNLGKKILIEKVWLNAGITEFQSYEAQVKRFSFLSTINGWYKFLCGALGKMFYLLVSTQFMLLYFFKSCYKKIVHFYKDGNYNAGFYIYIFLALSFIFTLGITCVFINSPETTTYLFYGRYNEYIIGIYIIIGLCEFFYARCPKFDAICIVLFIVISIICKAYMTIEGIQNGNCSILTPAITHFYNEENNFEMERCSLFTINWFVLLILIRESKSKKKVIWICVTVLCINIWAGFSAFNDFFIESKIKINNVVASMAMTIQDMQMEQEIKVCVVVTENKKVTGTYVKTVQFVLKDFDIDTCSQDAIKQIYKNYDFVITFDNLWVPENEMCLVYSEEEISMYCKQEVGFFERYNQN